MKATSTPFTTARFTSGPFTSAPFTITAIVAALSAALTTAACANDGSAGGDAAEPASENAASAQTASAQAASDNYLDAAHTPGTWTYLKESDETLALFGENPRAPAFMVRCGDGVVSLGRVSASEQSGARMMNVTAETGTRQLEAAPVPQRPIIIAADLAPDDALLDAIAITKGRFMIDVEGEEPLYLPAWVEVSRVIEDCR